MSVLSEASKAYSKEPGTENMDQILVALMISLETGESVFLPAQVSGENMDVQLGMVQASDGGWYGIMCTCQEQIKKLSGAVSVTMDLHQVLNSVLTTEGMAGLVIDPGNNANCFLKRQDITVLMQQLNSRKTASTDTKLN